MKACISEGGFNKWFFGFSDQTFLIIEIFVAVNEMLQ